MQFLSILFRTSSEKNKKTKKKKKKKKKKNISSLLSKIIFLLIAYPLSYNMVLVCVPVPDVIETWSVVRFFSNIKSEMRSFKSNENIHKKEGGSYYVVSANKASSVTL